MNKRVGVVGVLSVVLVGLVGLVRCAGPDTTRVPTVAAEPWACTGVPMRAIELMSGQEDLKVEEEGSWGKKDDFDCFVNTRDGHQALNVSSEFDYTGVTKTEKRMLPGLAATEGAVALDGGDTPGGGYAYPLPDGRAEAVWWSGAKSLVVTLRNPAGGDRDPVADVGTMLVSMLPWAFGGQEPPKQTVEM